MSVAWFHWCSLPRKGIDCCGVSCSQQVVRLLTGPSHGLREACAGCRETVRRGTRCCILDTVKRSAKGDSWVIDFPEGESRRGQKHVGKAGGTGRRVWCRPARPARSGESWIACIPISSGGTAHAPLPRLGRGAITSVPFEFCGTYSSRDGRCAASTCKGMNGAPTSREHVQHHRNMGWPTGREP
jgi:hypothetical protein